ncbi:uncharacterized protein [Henckelia pumila]|uniref:uncharacterized protein isoform X2 n=1 Tax=Henckelia pumila TaxID=405737 RepID=UPI003C6DF618
MLSSEKVSQRLMVQGYSGHATYTGVLDVTRQVIKTDGIRGLYRGFGLFVMTCSPSSVVWWASYGTIQRVLWRLLGHIDEPAGAAPSEGKIVMVQAAGGIFAGSTASCITTPLDTIKTRLQVMGHEKKPTVREVVKNLFADGGVAGFCRGLGPRFFMCLISLNMFFLILYFLDHSPPPVNTWPFCSLFCISAPFLSISYSCIL